MGRGIARRDPTHVTPKIKLCIHTIYHIKSVAPRVCLAKVLFFASFGPGTKTEVGMVILKTFLRLY